MDTIHSRIRRFAAGVAALAGFVDAYGFMATHGFFVSFMSGNSTRLAVGIAEWSVLAAIPATIITAFIAGVAAGEGIGLRYPVRRARNVLLFTAGLLAIAAFAADIDVPLAFGVAGAMAMGSTNAIFSREDRLPVGLTYMTGTLVLIGQAIIQRVTRGVRSQIPLLFAHWLSLIVGGIAGVLAFDTFAHAAPWFAVASAALLALLAPRFVRPPRD